MSEEKIPLHELQAYVRDARRYYAAGETEKAKAKLRAFKRRAEKAVALQQEAMSRELQRHLDLRNATLETVKEARDLSLHMKDEQGPS